MVNHRLNYMRFTLAVIFSAFAVVLTHLPESAIPFRLEVNGFDKLAHALAYGVITFLFLLSFKTSFTLRSVMLLLFAIISGGAMDELTQPLFIRIASLDDWLANIVGIIVALYAFLFFGRLRRRTSVNAGI